MFGFGIERIGLLSLRHPGIVLAVLAVITALAIAGFTRIGFSSDIREVFRADTPDYATLEDMTQHFAASERDIYVVLDGADLFTAKRLGALRDFALDARLIDGVSGVLSMFSARLPPPGPEATAPELFPFAIDAGTDLAALRAEVAAHPLVAGKLLSEDARLALMVITLSEASADLDAIRRVGDELRAAAQPLVERHGLSVAMTGLPAIRSTIVAILTSDQLVFRFTAFALSVLLSWAYFRDWRYLLLAVLPPAIAGIWLVGGMGWAGQKITVITNVVPSLVMVITFSNAIHLLLAVSRAFERGEDTKGALRAAVTRVGPATAMTAATTAIALSTLLLAGRPAITGFGLTAAVGTTLACLVVLTLLPALGVYVLRGAGPVRRGHRLADLAGWSVTISAATARLVRARAVPVAAAGIAIFGLCAALYAQNQPQFRYGANLPNGTEVERASRILDERLAGSSTLRLFVTWQPGDNPVGPRTLSMIGDAHAVLEGEPLLRDVWSLERIARFYRDNGHGVEELLALVNGEGADAFARVVLPRQGAALVTGQMPDIEASELLALEEQLASKLADLRAMHPQARFELTGIALQSARSAHEMIGALNRSLLTAIIVIIALIGISLRSLRASLLSVLPNLLPISVAGAYLYLTGKELQFTSIIVFTISFGIAVDSTIHMLNHHYRGVRDGANWHDALGDTVRRVGPALIIATLALMAGGVTMLSPLPMAQLYGQLMVLVLAAALIGDLLFLPALIAVTRRLRGARA